ncbi:phosphatidylinositol phosphate phosphatase [Crucibulum laeve]|uniref:phosphoinositide 5-phosphatase n=1 Tax=Crucibulum laeve TaxID=68775 RepID=A0A5C3MQZ9_9AGAR|nr:phosphatidylinositol phosphate phosphatase [Crucibulum laeve]
MGLLHYISYGAVLAAFAFVTLSLASGLLYVSELIEEHSRTAKVIGQRGIYVIILLHVLLYFFDALPLLHTAFSITCHIIYLQNFSHTWPIISLTSPSFLASCALVVADHFIWFFHFAKMTNEAKHLRTYRGPVPNVPGFTEIASFFGICVWLAPLFLFLSLSANDNALPLSAIEPASPSVSTSNVPYSPSRTSLIRSMLAFFSFDKIPRMRPKPSRKDTSEGLIAPRTPSAPRTPHLPPPSPSPQYNVPRSPGRSMTQELDVHLSPNMNFKLNPPPRRSSQGPINGPVRRPTGDSSQVFGQRRTTMPMDMDDDTTPEYGYTWDTMLSGTHVDVGELRSFIPQAMYLYLGNGPRALYLVTSSHDEKFGRPARALIFRAGEGHSQAVVEFLPKDEVDLGALVRLTNRVVKGCLGLISVENDVFLAVVTSATEVGNTRHSAVKQESVARIHEVSFYSLTSSTWDDLSAATEPLLGPDAIETSINRDNYAQNIATQVFEHPCMPLTKILSSGSFYYALETQWDLSSRLAVRLARDPSTLKDASHFDGRFVWNEYIIRSLLDFRERLDVHERAELDECQFIILAIQGYVGVFTMALPAPPTNGSPAVATLALISRLGWKRAGTRFNTRGVDDDGNCANFVETETIFSTDQHSVSYVQVRGSVPLFWEQQGLQTFGQRIQITRPHASQPAFERHFMQVMEEYGSVHAINLLGTKENEAILTNAYARHLQIAHNALGDDLGITHFDFHNAVRIGGHDSVIRDLRRMESITDHIERFGFLMSDATADEIITDQKGVFRTNCLDCLDRTNFVQDILSRTTLEQYLRLVRLEWMQSNTLWTHHRELWAENGDALSKIYAGTGALNTSFTRSGKRTLAGVLSDATKSVSRAYINNFQDKSKQVAIDMFLGNLSNQQQVTIFDPIHDSVRTALQRRLSEYSTTKQCAILVGTWNLNGRPPSESLLPWLFPRETVDDPDMFVLGFQEIVPLTAQQIVQTDPDKRRVWEAKILETLDHRPNKKSDYVLLRSEQLVGTALLILVKSELTAVIRNVEGATRKTGLRGMSGNKGAVGIRLEYHDTSFCFLTAHLAAGHTMIEERNADYRTIANGLHFLKGKTIQSHENVIWLADTNYRIDLDNSTVRSLAERNDFDSLFAADQLRQAMDLGTAFVGFEEGPLLFPPTYRYDLGTDNYDTSEKMRIPAWTDRILYRGSQLDLAVYSRSELYGSDHKPVFGIFRAEVRIIDSLKRATLSRLLLESVVTTDAGEKLDEKLASLVLPADTGELPPPSSDETAWWNGPDRPDGAVPISELLKLDTAVRKGNPFDSPEDSPLSSPSTSDEELYTHALTLQTPMAPVPAGRRPPPPPPPPRPTEE